MSVEPTIRCGVLYDYLDSLGYAFKRRPTLFLFQHPEHELPIILPPTDPDEELHRLMLGSAFTTLQSEGVVEPMYDVVVGGRRLLTEFQARRASDPPVVRIQASTSSGGSGGGGMLSERREVAAPVEDFLY